MRNLGLQRSSEASLGKRHYQALHIDHQPRLISGLLNATQSADLAEALNGVDSMSKALSAFITEFIQPASPDRGNSAL